MASGNDIVSPAIGGSNGGVFVPVIDPVDLPADESVTVIALKSFSDGYVSMFKGEIREISAEKAASYISNEFVAVYVPAVPDVGENDKDKYLHTNAETGVKEWSAVPSELPSVTASDKDKYLHTNASTGAVEWSEVSGGSVEEIVYYLKLTDVQSGSTVTKIYKDSACTQEFTETDAPALKAKLDGGARIIFKIGTSRGYVIPSFISYVLSGSTYWRIRSGFVFYNSTGTNLINVFLSWGYDNT